MGSHPINLAIRFLLEIFSLVSISIWGWKQSQGWLSYALAIGIPIVFAAIWGIFTVVNDPSRSGSASIPVSGIVRLGIEFLFFGLAIWALYNMELKHVSLLFGSIVLIHYVISYNRIYWLLQKKVI